MKSFRQFLNEDKQKVYDRFKKQLDGLPTVPTKQNWIHPSQIQQYGNDPAEVSIKHLGLKQSSEYVGPHSGPKKWAGKTLYKNSGLVNIELDKQKLYFSQPSVNKAKLANFATNYRPDPKDFHRADQQRKFDAPVVIEYPDNTMYVDSHHRVAAAILRGDKTMVVRKYRYKQVPSKNYSGAKTYSQERVKDEL